MLNEAQQRKKDEQSQETTRKSGQLLSTPWPKGRFWSKSREKFLKKIISLPHPHLSLFAFQNKKPHFY